MGPRPSQGPSYGEDSGIDFDPTQERVDALKLGSSRRWGSVESAGFVDDVVFPEVCALVQRFREAIDHDAHGEEGEDIADLIQEAHKRLGKFLKLKDRGNMPAEVAELQRLVWKDTDRR